MWCQPHESHVASSQHVVLTCSSLEQFKMFQERHAERNVTKVSAA